MSDDKKKVESICNLISLLEQEKSPFDVQVIDDLKNQISSLKISADPIIQKLVRYENSISTQMTERHLSTIAVPFERYLKRSIADDDFLVNSTDRDHLVNEKAPLHFVLDNMRSAFNVGSIFRTADTLGARKIWLTGYTATPHQMQVERAALGAAAVIEWHHCKFDEAIADLVKNGVQLIALETTSHAEDISADFDFSKPTAFIMGNERFGLEANQIKLADEVRQIPTYGLKNSLNVAVAAAIAGFEWRKQYQKYLLNQKLGEKN
jgi:23S rRNA (guanosine2251-2'-O)-methyltransferase